jgi:hypothetical protein
MMTTQHYPGRNTLTSVRAAAFEVSDVARLARFRENDHLLICKHVFEDHYRGPLHIENGGKFSREDGTIGRAAKTLLCGECSKVTAGEYDCHEWVYRDGWFYLADRLPEGAQ